MKKFLLLTLALQVVAQCFQHSKTAKKQRKNSSALLMTPGLFVEYVYSKESRKQHHSMLFSAYPFS